MLTKIGTFFKHRWAFIIGVICTWAIPIYLLNEQIALTTQVKAGIKITFMGIVVLAVLFLAFRKRLYAKVYNIKHGIVRGLLMLLHRSIAYGLVFGALWGTIHFADKLYGWWQLSGLAMILGAIFYIIDEMLFTLRERANLEQGGNANENDNLQQEKN